MSEEEIVEILDKYRKDNLEIWRIPSSYECEQLREAIQGLLDLYNKGKRKIKIKDEYCKLLINIGYDYDGCNTVESLKELIDELVDLARKAIKNDDKSIMYMGSKGTDKNILFENVEVEEKKENG